MLTSADRRGTYILRLQRLLDSLDNSVGDGPFLGRELRVQLGRAAGGDELDLERRRSAGVRDDLDFVAKFGYKVGLERVGPRLVPSHAATVPRNESMQDVIFET